MKIDWDFIARLEGAKILDAYVPQVGTSKSGVTIATGVDIGQRSVDDINRLYISAELKERLRLYCGLIGQAAADKLREIPLRITKEEAEELDQAVAQPILFQLAQSYDAERGSGAFDALPPAVQTVLTSIAYQYGPNLKRRTPKFWGLAVQQRWSDCIHELENFGDRYHNRRQAEARLLRENLA